ncbi:hypothetical protein CIB93_04445 [Streptomyces sp. WZ.A104]|uniref:hypothetical protein n=1 Tax=Streptomyces sp. WZ.A104 TaxID=2023771 RepID=UPI000BBCA21D|nr:hypothetical protein [Streptomyces sp. WZ.A104]PCG87102.1 hypothetical protein CIB93_04445 [Streptomyces sp. WZ.A104]
MPTTYPTSLPAVPENRWDAEKLADRGIERPAEGRPVAVADFALDAGTAEQAELRLLAYIDRAYEDDLRGATATAAEESAPGRWRVTLRVPGEF